MLQFFSMTDAITHHSQITQKVYNSAFEQTNTDLNVSSLVADFCFFPKELCSLHDKILAMHDLIFKNNQIAQASPSDVSLLIFRQIFQKHITPLREQIEQLNFPLRPIPLPHDYRQLNDRMQNYWTSLSHYENALNMAISYAPGYIETIEKINDLIREINLANPVTLNTYKAIAVDLQLALQQQPRPLQQPQPPQQQPQPGLDYCEVFLTILSHIVEKICNFLRWLLRL